MDEFAKILTGLKDTGLVEESTVTAIQSAFDSAVARSVESLVEEGRSEESTRVSDLKRQLTEANVKLREVSANAPVEVATKISLIEEEFTSFKDEIASEYEGKFNTLVEEQAELRIKSNIALSGKIDNYISEGMKVVEESYTARISDLIEENLDMKDQYNEVVSLAKLVEEELEEKDCTIEEQREEIKKLRKEVKNLNTVIEESVVEEAVTLSAKQVFTTISDKLEGMGEPQKKLVVAMLTDRSIDYVEEHVEECIDTVIEESVRMKRTSKRVSSVADLPEPETIVEESRIVQVKTPSREDNYVDGIVRYI